MEQAPMAEPVAIKAPQLPPKVKQLAEGMPPAVRMPLVVATQPAVVKQPVVVKEQAA